MRVIPRAAVAALIAAAAALTLAPAPASAGTVPATPVALPGGRTFYLHPTGSGRTNSTVVVVLHGYHSNARTIETTTGWDTYSDAHAFTVAYGQSAQTDGSWNAGVCCGTAKRAGTDDVAYLDELITYLRRRGNTRIFLVGHSNGGMMVFRYLVARRGGLSGYATVNGPYEAKHFRSARGLHGRMAYLYGTADTTVPPGGASYSSYLGCTVRGVSGSQSLLPGVTFTTKAYGDAGHGWMPGATDDLFRYFSRLP